MGKIAGYSNQAVGILQVGIFLGKLNRYLKLGASPQLECWNDGILEKWLLGY